MQYKQTYFSPLPETAAVWSGEVTSGCAVLDDDALLHEDDLVGHGSGELHLMGCHDHGHAGCGRKRSMKITDCSRTVSTCFPVRT